MIDREVAEMTKSRIWSYKNLGIKEGLKPKSKHFQYFFVVSEKGKKRCNYCVWVDGRDLSRFSSSGSFEEIVSSQREEWSQWVREKIDQKDFRNLVWKLEEEGPREINLEDLSEKLEPD
jgi:hypothetical protein